MSAAPPAFPRRVFAPAGRKDVAAAGAISHAQRRKAPPQRPRRSQRNTLKRHKKITLRGSPSGGGAGAAATGKIGCWCEQSSGFFTSFDVKNYKQIREVSDEITLRSNGRDASRRGRAMAWDDGVDVRLVLRSPGSEAGPGATRPRFPRRLFVVVVGRPPERTQR